MNEVAPLHEQSSAWIKSARSRAAARDILERLACHCHNIRQRQQWTQIELSQWCGFEPDYIRHVEISAARVTLGELETLAITLGCTLRDWVRRLHWKRRWGWPDAFG